MHWAKHCAHHIKNDSANIAQVSESDGEDLKMFRLP